MADPPRGQLCHAQGMAGCCSGDCSGTISQHCCCCYICAALVTPSSQLCYWLLVLHYNHFYGNHLWRPKCNILNRLKIKYKCLYQRKKDSLKHKSLRVRFCSCLIQLSKSVLPDLPHTSSLVWVWCAAYPIHLGSYKGRRPGFSLSLSVLLVKVVD